MNNTPATLLQNLKQLVADERFEEIENILNEELKKDKNFINSLLF